MRSIVLLAALIIDACGAAPQPPLVATSVVVSQPMPGMGMSAAYLSLTNNTDQAIRISRVSSAQYESVQMHESTVEDGVARMRALSALQIPAGATVTLERGGKHLMLMRPKGTFQSVSLQFFDGDDLILNVDATLQPNAN